MRTRTTLTLTQSCSCSFFLFSWSGLLPQKATTLVSASSHLTPLPFMSSSVARLALRVTMRQYRHPVHVRVGVHAPRYAEGLFYPTLKVLKVPHVKCRLHVPHFMRLPRTRATDDTNSNPSTSTSTYDPAILMASPCGYLVTVRSAAGGESVERTHRAVEEARWLLTHCENPPATLGGKVEQLLADTNDTIALHPKGELGCAYLPLRLTQDARETPFPVGNPVVALGERSLDCFVKEPFAPDGTPEYLSRLIPVETICAANEDKIVDALRDILPQSIGSMSKDPNSSSGLWGKQSSKNPTTFDLKYAHFGKTKINRQNLLDRITSLFPSGPQFEINGTNPDKAIKIHVYHDVALISVLPRWQELRGYNQRDLLSTKTVAASDARGDKHDDVKTTGGEGYP